MTTQTIARPVEMTETMADLFATIGEALDVAMAEATAAAEAGASPEVLADTTRAQEAAALAYMTICEEYGLD